MQKRDKPFILTIAGFDPSGGAGILADIKTMEANGGYGLAVQSANTWQNDIAFRKCEWTSLTDIKEQIHILLDRIPVQYIKIGLIENMDVLYELVLFLKASIPAPVIVWDPVLKASAGFVFHGAPDQKKLESILREISCVTPNLPEAKQLFGDGFMERIPEISHYCAVYLKGGHAPHDNRVTDVLYAHAKSFSFSHAFLPEGEKHGSGCVLSAALVTQLANGADIAGAAEKASDYTFRFLASNKSYLGYHQYQAEK